MDNANQQVPPVPNEPSIKAANNLSFLKALAYGFVIISIGISIAIGGYLLGVKQNLPLSQISQNEQKLADAKKRDLRIISEMTQSKIIAELINSDNGNYSRVNCSNIQLNSLCSDIKRLSGQEFAFYSSDSAYCGYAKLSSGSYGGYYCLDSIYSGKTDINPNGVNYCNSNTYTCPPVSSVVDSESSFQNQTDPTANWKTYKDVQYGLELKYPTTWSSIESTVPKNPYLVFIALGPTISIQSGGVMAVTLRNQTESKYISILEEKGFQVIQRTDILIGAIKAYRYKFGRTLESGSKSEQEAIVAMKNGILYEIIGDNNLDAQNKKIFDQILSTFKFTDINPGIAVSAKSALLTTCEDKQEGVPVITSLSSYFGSIGTKIEIMGCNFSGFEGDKNAWIENGQGIKGILYGEEGSTSKSLKVTLKSPLCQRDNSGSGLPCDTWLTLNPGTYKIYTSPWSKKSNEVNFTIK